MQKLQIAEAGETMLTLEDDTEEFRENDEVENAENDDIVMGHTVEEDSSDDIVSIGSTPRKLNSKESDMSTEKHTPRGLARLKNAARLLGKMANFRSKASGTELGLANTIESSKIKDPLLNADYNADDISPKNVDSEASVIKDNVSHFRKSTTSTVLSAKNYT